MVTKKQIDLAQPGQQVIEVTPAQAKIWLLLNKNNRKTKGVKIVQYARDMREGNWKFTGEAIKFNDLGDLVDGQNRLHALIDSETTQPFLVVTGLVKDAQAVMDSGAPRNAGDALVFHGYKYPNELAASARTHYFWKRAGGFAHCMSSPNTNLSPTNAELVDYVAEHPELVDAARNTKTVARQLRIAHGALGAAYYEFLRIDPDDTQEFFDRIREFKTGGKGDPINTLIKRAQDMAMRREIVRASTSLFMVNKTWNAVRNNEYLEKLTFGSLGRWSLIPDPK